jgi:bifunctional non-homologous end joining protein LigD
MSLQEYHRKRDFSKTEEPPGKKPKAKRSALHYVVQKHDASRLHYDFRLEMDGTLKSWAVPKGVPYEKAQKRLAVQVEDHPLDYANFEGIIPEGQYGGGTVMVWDTGTYHSLGSDPTKDLESGKLHLDLQGKKLHGEWTLVRTRRGEGNEWLLIKSGDDVKPVSKKKDNESCLTGRSMAEIARQKDARWQSSRVQKKANHRLPKLTFIDPMKATLVEAPPTSGEWLYEVKFDGYRALALKSGSDVQLLSRNEKDFAGRFPEIVEAVKALSPEQIILDGEIVALDEEGRPSFQLLQGLELGVKRPPIAFYVFDLLELEGTRWLDRPLHERRQRLQALMKSAAEPMRYSATIKGDPVDLLEAVRARGLEGLIGKERDSLYDAGRRSRSWIKLKCVHEQEFVIGGCTPPEGTRKHFGALLVGIHEGKELKFAGKVGTGFDAALLRSLMGRMKAIALDRCPFANLPEKKQGRWSQNITPTEMRRCHWVKPELICQVRFTEWTDDGKLRHPVFVGLRQDKQPRDVRREKPARTK